MDEEDELQTTFFEPGVVLPWDWTGREIAEDECDGTFLRAQHEESDKRKTRKPGGQLHHLEVYIGVRKINGSFV